MLLSPYTRRGDFLLVLGAESNFTYYAIYAVTNWSASYWWGIASISLYRGSVVSIGYYVSYGHFSAR
jgi:hypothetical protein